MLLSDVMLSIVMLCDIMLCVVIPIFILQSVTIPSVVMPNVIMLSVTLLSIFITENTKGGSITVLLTSCLTCLDLSVLQLKTKIVSCHIADSKPIKQKVNCTVILPPLVFPCYTKCLYAY